MRREIDVDVDLLNRAIAANGDVGEEALLEDALRLGLQIRGQAGIRKLFGAATWEGNLEESRRSKVEEFEPSKEVLQRLKTLRGDST